MGGTADSPPTQRTFRLTDMELTGVRPSGSTSGEVTCRAMFFAHLRNPDTAFEDFLKALRFGCSPLLNIGQIRYAAAPVERRVRSWGSSRIPSTDRYLDVSPTSNDRAHRREEHGRE